MEAPSGHRHSYTFTKAERLKSRKLIKALFTESASFGLYPLRILYRLHPEPQEASVQVVVSVSKRRFKRAVDRNRIKRQLREAYRHYKHPLLPLVPSGHTLLLGIVYTGKEATTHNEIEAKLKKGIDRLSLKAPFSNTISNEKK
ncbi:MAG TPA: ribonuclease P protein component [Cytophagales bacterium]|nr:ribonuclease P protein component [Cytophagales bacterium]HAA24047.1 ribonuclease P protein component [Cytophagales bacterium]HAP64699.1 ribonuclease P protein component [Cytophagales bacterium]